MELAAFEKANGPPQFIWMRFSRKRMSRDKLTKENHSLVTIYTLAAK